jgi:hypothetical protein
MRSALHNPGAVTFMIMLVVIAMFILVVAIPDDGAVTMTGSQTTTLTTTTARSPVAGPVSVSPPTGVMTTTTPTLPY